MTILQFGTSRFLQAHVDLFVGEALERGVAAGRIAVVQTTDSPESRRRVEVFKTGAPYPVRLRGLTADGPLDETRMVGSIATGFHASSEWADVLGLAADLTHIVSNTGDRSYVVAPGDRPDADVPVTFPAKVLAVLAERWRVRPDTPIAILPCELRAGGNARLLKGLVTGLARDWSLDPAFVDWIETACPWPNTLVDRIVTGDLQPVGAVAEPYALWAIEDVPGFVPPCVHEAVVVTDDLDRYARLKLFLLNAPHVVLVEYVREAAVPVRFVCEAMETPAVRAHLDVAYEEMLAPFFRAGMEAEARAYKDETLRRFANPFLDHEIAAIRVDLPQKARERIGGLIAWSDELGVPADAQPILRRLLAEASGT